MQRIETDSRRVAKNTDSKVFAKHAERQQASCKKYRQQDVFKNTDSRLFSKIQTAGCLPSIQTTRKCQRQPMQSKGDLPQTY